MEKRDFNLQKAINGVLMLSVCTAIGSFLIAEVYEPDMWWQLVIGSDIITTRSIPATDHFTLAGFGKVYHDSHWLFQVVQAAAHKLWGFGGVELLMVAIWSATFLICYRTMRRSASVFMASVLLLSVAMSSSMRFLPRPELITYLMIPLFYDLLMKGRYQHPGELALFGLLQTVWANCHGLFVIGPVLVGCYCGGAAVMGHRRGNGDGKALCRLLGVVIVATFLTPFGFKGWEYALLLFQEASANSAVSLKLIGELGPTFSKASMHAPAFWFYLVLLLVTAMTGIWACMRRTVSLERLLIVVVLAVSSTLGRRNMPLFALVAGPFVAEQLSMLLPRKVRGERYLALAVAFAAFLWSLYPLSGRYYQDVFTPARFGWGVTPSYYPQGFPAFLKRIGFRGNIYTSQSLGGFLLYHFYPAQLPLSDGRWEVYGRKELDFIEGASSNPLLWRQLVTKYAIKGALLQHASFEARRLIPYFLTDSTWRLVYFDYGASFWLRSDAPELPAAASIFSTTTLPPPSPRIDDLRILDYFLANTGALELRLQNLQRLLAFKWKEEIFLEKVGDVHLKLGRWQDAENTFQQIVAMNPDNGRALGELAFLSFRRGDIQGSRLYVQRAKKIDPSNASIRELEQHIKLLYR